MNRRTAEGSSPGAALEVARASGGATHASREALKELLDVLRARLPLRSWSGTRSLDGWTVTFAGDPTGRLSIPPSWCDKIVPASAPMPLYRYERRVHAAGEGLPVVMHQQKPAGNAGRFIPPNGRHLPATLTAEFRGEKSVTLTFHHTGNVRTVTSRGAVRPLAIELTAAISDAMPRRMYTRYAFRGLFRPDIHLHETGVYLPEPFDPKKIPVVLVHGFESAPHIWGNAMNEIAADPVLSRRYQVWYFLYPTGMTTHAAAASLRHSLREVVAHYDPEGRIGPLRNMILAGHSMGGFLARMQVIDSGDDIYRAFFTVPLAKLPLSAKNKNLVSKALYFDRLPFVGRVVFIATPHRGSEVADKAHVRLLSRLIHPTATVRGLLRELSSVASHAVSPGLRRFRDFGARSTATLSTQHPLLPAVGRRPVLVPFHNIIAVFPPRSFHKPLTESTDGVVTWRSAWLPGAESTAVVTGFHICAELPEVTRELLRILRIHAAKP